MKAVSSLDLESSDMVNKITTDMKNVGVEIHLARVKHEVMELLKKDGVEQTVGNDHIHDKVLDAIKWFEGNENPDAK